MPVQSRDLALCHRRAVAPFRELADRLELLFGQRQLPCRVMIFETYRNPARQLELFRKGTSKALPFQSAHQFGLAVDYVPLTDRKWTWEPPDPAHVWGTLRKEAEALGLWNGLDWDRAHVEHPLWRDKLREFMVF